MIGIGLAESPSTSSVEIACFLALLHPVSLTKTASLVCCRKIGLEVHLSWTSAVLPMESSDIS